MKRLGLVFGIALLTAGCLPQEQPLLPDLKGRWAPERGVEMRVAVASSGSSAGTSAVRPTPSLREMCENEYVTFRKGAVVLHRGRQTETVFMVREARREGARVVLIGREPNHPLAGSEDARIELQVRGSEISFQDVIDNRGRSLRYDRFDNPQAAKAGVHFVGDVFRLMFDLKSCPG